MCYCCCIIGMLHDNRHRKAEPQQDWLVPCAWEGWHRSQIRETAALKKIDGFRPLQVIHGFQNDGIMHIGYSLRMRIHGPWSIRLWRFHDSAPRTGPRRAIWGTSEHSFVKLVVLVKLVFIRWDFCGGKGLRGAVKLTSLELPMGIIDLWLE